MDRSEWRQCCVPFTRSFMNRDGGKDVLFLQEGPEGRQVPRGSQSSEIMENGPGYDDGPLVFILALKDILGQVRSCNLLGRRAGQGSNKRLIQAEICLDIPPGAAFGGAPRALRALGRGDI